MNKKKLSLHTIFLPAALAIVLFGGCTKEYEKKNTDPYGVTEGMMKYDGLKYGAPLAQMQRNVFAIAQQPLFGDEMYQITQNLCADIYSGYMAAPRYWYQNADNTTYALYPNWYSAAFNQAYTNIMTPWNELRKSTEKDNMPHIFAIGQILKVEGMHRVTDMYGPLPYLKFGDGSTQLDYDSQEAIYNSFFTELNTAITELTNFYLGNPSAKLMEYYDYIYKGDVVKWIRFANSLRLRLAMRIVYANPTKAKQEAEAAVNHAIGVMTDISETAALQNGSSISYNNPLYVICNDFDDIRMGATMDAYMNGYADPRMPKYFLPTSDGTYHGVRTGINITSSNMANYRNSTIISKLNIASDKEILWMSASEVYFLRAEGAARGWSMGAAAQSLYEEGIRKSMDSWGVSPGDYITSVAVPATYTDPVVSGNNAGAPSAITIAWDEAATLEVKLERIITQKWIAMYPDGMEAWSEFRRTSYPRIFPVLVNNSAGTINSTTQIRRMPFPTSEYLGNSAGVQKGVTLLGGADNGGTKLWWDKK